MSFCRSQTDQWTQTLTTVTHEMTECESEMEEHELKIELLRKQLELAKSGRNQCRHRRLELQEKVCIAVKYMYILCTPHTGDVKNCK